MAILVSPSFLHTSLSFTNHLHLQRRTTKTPEIKSTEIATYSFKEKKRRRCGVVTRAGPPSTNSLIFAFVFPLSLLAVTIFTSIRTADKLDQDFLEELAIGELETEDQDQDQDVELNSPTSVKKKPALPRMRNRPKREAEV
ncbi:hypothetical protein GIB67_019886 [Kingdonia uniflora]|uniref:Uncharacterized protein n=1 Tax=Kingdonia uniflora TaxID=39325 RepID=A0A7J7MKR3_9MAGN|nr:hypothetical protein GIB67_019886 [Kingdonia uniflora]